MDYADLRLESCTDKIQHSVRRQDDKLLATPFTQIRKERNTISNCEQRFDPMPDCYSDFAVVALTLHKMTIIKIIIVLKY